MKHYCTRILLAALMSMAGANAFAYDISVENSQGITIYYNYSKDGRELIVTDGNVKYAGAVIIPEEVTYMNRTRKVTSIGKQAFQYCKELTSVSIPNSVTTIDEKAFSSCANLKSITIPNSVTSIGYSAFFGCGLTSLTIPDSVKEIGSSAFLNCKHLGSLTIGDNVTIIRNGAFQQCEGLTSIIIPNSVKSIGEYCFDGCTGLTSVSLGNGLASIGERAFGNCSGLTSITIPPSVTYIGAAAFSDSNISSVHITDIAAWCNIRFDYNPLYIAHYLYLNGKEITELIIPEGVTKISDNAFRKCTCLTSVTIPSSIQTIGFMAFDGEDLVSIISRIDNPSEIQGKNASYPTFTKNTYNNATLYVPAGTAEKYKATRGWKDFIFIEEQ